jgi:hypothetical protein
MIDPLFVHQLALDLGKSLRELGETMSAHELTVLWPLFYERRAAIQKREEEKWADRR